MEPSPLFSWIHLSDIHIGHGDATHVEDQKLVLDALRRDVEQTLSSGALRPDAIFVTGDIAFSGACRTKDEYTRAEQWLSDIAKAAGLSLGTVFVVPGNHDVQRPADKPMTAAALLRELRDGRSSLDAALADSDARTQLTVRQANYLKFAASFAPACRTDAESSGAQLYWQHRLMARGGVRLRLVGLNTALLSADEAVFESDQGRLWLGTKQLSAAFTEPDIAPGEVVLVLSHHPLHDRWLADETATATWIRSRAHLHLSGHVHEATSERARGGGGTDFISIAAGAVHGEKTPRGYPARHGYSFGALVKVEGVLKVRVLPRMWSDTNKDFRLDVDNVPRNATYAEHDLPRVHLTEDNARASSTTSLEIGAVDPRAPAPVEPPVVSIARLPSGTAQFVGRTEELTALDQAWSNAGTHVMMIVAWGGAGKSALVSEWLVRMAQEKWRGATRVFGWSFYSQGSRDDGTASADLFINAALSFFGDADPTKGSSWERGERLSALVRRQRALLVLDGLEPLQEPESSGGRLRDLALMALLRELAASMDGLCIVSTRQQVSELSEFFGKTAVRHYLELLSEHDGARLLRLCGVEGAEEELLKVARAVEGHALTLTLLGHYIADALGRDVRRWREVPLGAVETRLGERARHVMAAYDRWFKQGPEQEILRLVGLFDRPAGAGGVAALRKKPAISGVTDTLVALTEAQWNLAVNRLRRARLLAPAGQPDDGMLDAHPLVRECFGEILARENPEGFCAAHGRLYEHLRDTTPQFPDTFDGMQPLYQAVWHGCRAGRHQEALHEVLFERIHRGKEHYSLRRLGAFGANLTALAGFFKGDWTRPSTMLDEMGQTWLLDAAGTALRALGRSREAVASMKLGLEADISLAHWVNAATSASTLSELYSSLGALHDALALSDQGIEFAELSGRWYPRLLSACSRARVLHTIGRREEARIIFEEAERVWSAREQHRPLLNGGIGYLFCDLLLDLGEATEVERRAKQTLVWAEEEKRLLEIALNHLLLGHSLWMLEQRDDARPHFTQAIDGLRAAGDQGELASALVLRVTFLRDVNENKSARRDLDEALGLATRCELRLVECDVYLEQSRLALATNDLLTARTTYDAARALIDECKYHRRDCELGLLEARLALAVGDLAAARDACERVRAMIAAAKLHRYYKELAKVEAAVA